MSKKRQDPAIDALLLEVERLKVALERIRDYPLGCSAPHGAIARAALHPSEEKGLQSSSDLIHNEAPRFCERCGRELAGTQLQADRPLHLSFRYLNPV